MPFFSLCFDLFSFVSVEGFLCALAFAFLCLRRAVRNHGDALAFVAFFFFFFLPRAGAMRRMMVSLMCTR